MDYRESRAYIKDAEKYGSVLGLSNMKELMARLKNPQDNLKFVHVGGTNGKGSVIAYLYTVLSRAGYRVGRYISPTLYSYRERLEVSGERISREHFAKCMTEIAEAVSEMEKDGLPHPTPFELETAAAFLFFRDAGCELVLLEVGMGGNLDATNIITTTKLALLVSISMDHMAFLGNTLREIAEKKAGIIKPGCEVITVSQEMEAMEAIREACEQNKVCLTIADDKEAKILHEDCFGQSFCYEGEDYTLSLAGVYQKQNAVLAIRALQALEKMGFPTTLKQRKEGLYNTCWNGRFTVIHKKPLLIVDGAHNPGAAEKMAECIRHYFKGKKLYYIMGMFRDKDYDKVLSMTAAYANKILTIQTPDNPRALSALELKEAAEKYNKDTEAFDSMKEAVEKAFSLAGEEDVILAFGSLSFIGELTRIVKEREEKEHD